MAGTQQGGETARPVAGTGPVETQQPQVEERTRATAEPAHPARLEPAGADEVNALLHRPGARQRDDRVVLDGAPVGRDIAGDGNELVRAGEVGSGLLERPPGEELEPAFGVARRDDREGGLEPIGPLVADRPAERLDQVIPVEQLDRGREAALADPADRGSAVGHEEDPLGVEHPEPGAGRGEPLGERRPRPGPPDVRPIGQCPAGPADAARTVEDEADLDLELGARGAVVDHRLSRR